jgi:hypothetical protein
MLDADVDRECDRYGTFNCALSRPGDGLRELDLEFEAFETGDIIGVHSTGSVALLYIGGRPCLV